jgi:hypothetical protein
VREYRVENAPFGYPPTFPERTDPVRWTVYDPDGLQLGDIHVHRTVGGTGCDLEDNRIARILFCSTEGQIVLLHGFMKKTRKTPKPDLDLARARQREVER